MAFRLYRTTRRLYRQVTTALQTLHVPAAVGANPTRFGLVALYVTGLVLLDARPSQTRISQALPARAHDALNRLLRTVPLSTRALLAGTVRLAAGLGRALGTPGYLVVDDVVIEKPFAKRLPWAAWTYSFAQKRKVYGCHIVLVSWTSDPTGPLAASRRLSAVAPQADLCAEPLSEEDGAGGYDAARAGGGGLPGGLPGRRHRLHWWLRQQVRRAVGPRLGGHAQSAHHRRLPGQRQAVRDLAGGLKLKWRPKLGVRARALRVYAPALGQVRLVVLKNRHGNFEYLVTNAVATDLTTLVAPQAEPLAHRDDFPRHQTTGGAGRLPVLGRSSAGPACRARLPDLRRAAGAPPRPARNRGGGQGTLAGRGPARRPGPAPALARRPAGVPSQAHCVSPVKK